MTRVLGSERITFEMSLSEGVTMAIEKVRTEFEI